MENKFVRAFKSFTHLPLWVWVWVFGILAPVNMATLFFLDTPTGMYGAWAFVFVCVTNIPLLFINGGITKVLAIPHLVAWVPLNAYVLHRSFLGSGYDAGNSETYLAFALLLANSISIGFDVYDTLEWKDGKRQILGYPDAKEII